MENENNIVELKISQKTSFEEKKEVDMPKYSTNPISKNFIKFLNSKNGKFSIKDIFR